MQTRALDITARCAFVLFLVFAHLPVSLAESGHLVAATAISGAPAGAMAWRIRYDTTDHEGRPVQSTGVLVAPSGLAPSGGRKVVAWAHGTTGIAEPCAPSLGPRALASIPALEQMVRQGWTVVATDYPGLGTPGPHAYLVGEAAAHAVLDSVRAARQVEHANASTQFIVWGLSQGAHAALFTGQEAHGYAPDLQLLGVAAAAPPTDLIMNLGDSSSPMVRTILTAFAVDSWSKVYHADTGTIAKPTARRLLHRLASTCGSEDPALRTKIQVARLRRQITDVHLTAIEPWRSLLVTNSAGGGPAGAPLFVAQGTDDAVVSADVTKRFVVNACGRGEQIRFVSILNGIHRTTATASAEETLRWMAGRFAGQPSPNDCPIR
ncbi:lipase family protein [Mesorhizobium sp. Cs1299R1N3]|uniref:lipase family protein n=1 Tax=Mesorhizobium sp. Cs1299R1N3 TaxID=3015173 RepID=UPI00301DE6C2